MLPVYYVNGKVTSQELSLARMSWDLIIEDANCVKFKRESEESQHEYTTAGDYFQKIFFSRLFDINPVMFSFVLSR